MIVRYTDRAKEDLESSFAWYEAQRRGLGFDFLDCIESSIMKILISPESYNIIYSNFRRCIIRRFPFSVFFTIENDEIIIHSVFYNRRNPEKRP
jgi:toxin ParE1/3/4